MNFDKPPEDIPKPNNEESNSEEFELNKALLEFSKEDKEIVLEEFKVLTRAIIPNLKDKIGNLKLLDEQSDEIKELFKQGKMPVHMKDNYGNQESLDSLLDTLSSSTKDLEDLKKYVLAKNIEAIKSLRDKRIEEYNKAKGVYSLSGEEVKKREDQFNKKLEEEREMQRLKDDIDRKSRLN